MSTISGKRVFLVNEVCNRLNVTRANYDLLLRFWKRMVSLGATEMFQELTHCPERLVFGTIPDSTQHLVARDYKPGPSPEENPSNSEATESHATHVADSTAGQQNNLKKSTPALIPPDNDSPDTAHA